MPRKGYKQNQEHREKRINSRRLLALKRGYWTSPHGINYSEKICLSCGEKITPTSGRQFYCGNQKTHGTCSYNHKQIVRAKNKRIRIRFCKTCQQKLTKKYVKYCDLCKNKATVTYYEKKAKKLKHKKLKLRFYILKKFNFTCQYCGRKSPNIKLQVDHIFPKSRGGTNSAGNFTVACSDCNVGKGDSILEELF
jgi:hypothetical protein